MSSYVEWLLYLVSLKYIWRLILGFRRFGLLLIGAFSQTGFRHKWTVTHYDTHGVPRCQEKGCGTKVLDAQIGKRCRVRYFC